MALPNFAKEKRGGGDEEEYIKNDYGICDAWLVIASECDKSPAGMAELLLWVGIRGSGLIWGAALWGSGDSYASLAVV